MDDLISKKAVIAIIQCKIDAYKKQQNYLKPECSTEGFSSTSSQMLYNELGESIEDYESLIREIESI